jgi:hypothetical protein
MNEVIARTIGDSAVAVQQMDTKLVAFMNATYAGVYTLNGKIYLPGIMRISTPSMLGLGEDGVGVPYIRYHDEESDLLGRVIFARYVDTSAPYMHIPGISAMVELEDLTQDGAFDTIRAGLRAINEILADARLRDNYRGLGHIQLGVEIEPQYAQDIRDRKMFSVSTRFKSTLYCPMCGTEVDSYFFAEPECSECNTRFGQRVDGFVAVPVAGQMLFLEVSDVKIPAVRFASITDLVEIPKTEDEEETVTLCTGGSCMIFKTEQEALQWLSDKGLTTDATTLQSMVGVDITDDYVTEHKDKFKPVLTFDSLLVSGGTWDQMKAVAEKEKIEIPKDVLDAVDGLAEGKGEFKRPYLIDASKAFPILDGNEVLVKLARKVIDGLPVSPSRDAAILALENLCEKCGEDETDSGNATGIKEIFDSLEESKLTVLSAYVDKLIEQKSAERVEELQRLVESKDSQIALLNEMVKTQRDTITQLTETVRDTLKGDSGEQDENPLTDEEIVNFIAARLSGRR